jgi:multicomponent Na+:H+ antiporter subunit G
MIDIIVMILAGLGSALILLAAIGMIRMPDFYMRVSVSTKASTLGIGLILIASGAYFDSFELVSRSTAIILFMLLTAPVGAHMLARACYKSDTRMWEKSVIDDLKYKYNLEKNTLKSGFEETESEPAEKEN